MAAGAAASVAPGAGLETTSRAWADAVIGRSASAPPMHPARTTRLSKRALAMALRRPRVLGRG
jgi:hypothetical protein